MLLYSLLQHILLMGGRDHTIHKLKRLGIEYSLIQKPELVSEEQLKTARRIVVMDYKKTEEVIKITHTLHQIDPFNAILSFAEYGLLVAAICSQQLDLPTNKLTPIENTRDKLKMRSLLKKQNLGTVDFKLCQSMEDVYTFFESFNSILLLSNHQQVQVVAAFILLTQ